MRLPALFMRFLMAGGLNTAITYAVYLVALQYINYGYAYTLSYGLGIVLAYALNRKFVFQSHRGWLSVVLMPAIYLAQYLLGLLIVWLWVDQLELWPELAPLIAIACSLPITFVLSKWVFHRHATSK